MTIETAASGSTGAATMVLSLDVTNLLASEPAQKIAACLG